MYETKKKVNSIEIILVNVNDTRKKEPYQYSVHPGHDETMNADDKNKN